jgi:hypothetical protein
MSVPPEVREAVYERDEYRCIAPRRDPDAGPCRNFHGDVIPAHRRMRPKLDITVEHVTPDYGRTGKRADDVVEQMVTLCWGHHLGHGVTGQGGSIWALRNKHLTREYLKELYP